MYSFTSDCTYSFTVAVMKQFNHPHIIKLFGVVTQGMSTYIVMELAPMGQVRIPGPVLIRVRYYSTTLSFIFVVASVPDTEEHGDSSIDTAGVHTSIVFSNGTFGIKKLCTS